MADSPPSAASGDAISIADIHAAAARLADAVVRTPLLESPVLNATLGGRLLVKAECLQRTGAFKIRGATNALACLDPATREAGVVTHSSGNHGQAVAAAAKAWGVPAAIVMPEDAPALKVRLTKAHGATVVFCTRRTREEVAQRVLAETGGTLIPPFDHPAVMAGQGTVGLEIAAQCAEQAVTPDQVLIPCGGGGLISGTALALRDAYPALPLYGVEPEGWDDTARALAGEVGAANDGTGSPFCDSLLSLRPGKLTLPLNRRLLAGVLSVDDRMVRRAMLLAFLHLKIVVEPGGAAALAAALAGKVDLRGKTTVVVASGGNVEPAVFAEVLGEAENLG